MLRKNNKTLIAFASFLLVGAIFLFPKISLAEVDVYGGGTSGVTEDTLRQETGLGDVDPITTAVRVINIFLGFLGIIAVSLIIYGGWIYMMSEGNEEKIERAKKILKNASIGLLIILSAFAIVSFILGRLAGRGSSGGPTGQGSPDFRSGFGAIGSCTVESVYPEDMQDEVPRNTSILVTFKEEIDPNTICGADECDGSEMLRSNVRIYMDGKQATCSDSDQSDCVEALVYSNDNKTFAFVPKNYFGSASEYIWYEVYMTNDILVDATQKGVFSECRSNLSWRFEVSNKLDLTPPKVLSVFPSVDNMKDNEIEAEDALPATGQLTVLENPEIDMNSSYQQAVKTNDAYKDITVSGVYNGKEDGEITLSVGSDNTKYLAEGPGCAIGGDMINLNGIYYIDNLCGLQIESNDATWNVGNEWKIEVKSAKTSDTFTVGNTTYKFVASDPGANEVLRGADENETASNVADVLDARSDIITTVSGVEINLEAATRGETGNDISLSSSDQDVIQTSNVSLTGGEKGSGGFETKGRKDKPRNAIIQINFDEAMMPVMVSGASDDVNEYIRIINNEEGSLGSGDVCSSDSQCRSFNCSETGLCINDYLDGRFEISNMYKTVEFISNDQCGVNNCGGKIYCLPGDANIGVEIEAASLIACTGDGDCSTKSPYVVCANDVCADSSGVNHPMGEMDGAQDVCFNSLDGDRDENPEGKSSYYNETDVYGLCDNDLICTNAESFYINKLGCASGFCTGDIVLFDLQNTSGDNYKWTFFTSDQMDLDPPSISLIPLENNIGVELNAGVTSRFNKVLMSSTLKTGGTITVDEKGNEIRHKNVNIWSYSNSPLGYWVSQQSVDDSPQDNEPDATIAEINHSMFSDNQKYRSQFGSGINDIYQNCYLPSSGPACSGLTKDTNASCCVGNPTAELDENGNCLE